MRAKDFLSIEVHERSYGIAARQCDGACEMRTGPGKLSTSSCYTCRRLAIREVVLFESPVLQFLDWHGPLRKPADFTWRVRHLWGISVVSFFRASTPLFFFRFSLSITATLHSSSSLNDGSAPGSQRKSQASWYLSNLCNSVHVRPKSEEAY